MYRNSFNIQAGSQATTLLNLLSNEREYNHQGKDFTGGNIKLTIEFLKEGRYNHINSVIGKASMPSCIGLSHDIFTKITSTITESM